MDIEQAIVASQWLNSDKIIPMHYNTFETTTSGNIHGIPFAAITNYEKNQLTSFHKSNYFKPSNAVLFGARDIDEPHELNNLKNAGITIITTEDIKKYVEK